MARKKTDGGTKQKSAKNLFDHLAAIKEGADETYWASLTAEERNDFRPWQVNRWLSMNPDWIELVDDFQRLTISMLSPQMVYYVYAEFIPKGRTYLTYIKPKDKHEVPHEVVELLCTHLECSVREALEYIDLMRNDSIRQESLLALMRSYGWQEKEIKATRKDMGL